MKSNAWIDVKNRRSSYRQLMAFWSSRKEGALQPTDGVVRTWSSLLTITNPSSNRESEQQHRGHSSPGARNSVVRDIHVGCGGSCVAFEIRACCVRCSCQIVVLRFRRDLKFRQQVATLRFLRCRMAMCQRLTHLSTINLQSRLRSVAD